MTRGGEIHLKAGQKLVVEAGSELTLKVGGNFLKIDASGITLMGSLVKINQGGAPGSGQGAAPELPKFPLVADDGTPYYRPPPAEQHPAPPSSAKQTHMTQVSNTSEHIGEPGLTSRRDRFDEEFILTQGHQDDTPLPNRCFVITLADGQTLQGSSDARGGTGLRKNQVADILWLALLP